MTLLHFHTRRRFVKTALTAATTLELQRAAVALGFSTHAEVCKLTAEQETGPFYLEDELLRSNIREDKAGVPLSLKFIVMNAQTCQPLSGAAIDLWHCDAGGVYSGFTKQSRPGPGGRRGDFGPPPGGPPPELDGHDRGFDNGPAKDFGPPPSARSTDKLTFLRGIQMTAADGSAHFETVFPGFYMGRTNHIHFKVRLGWSSDGKSYQAGHTHTRARCSFQKTSRSNSCRAALTHKPDQAHHTIRGYGVRGTTRRTLHRDLAANEARARGIRGRVGRLR
jgi:protocatechuate 3,4-dioxygenase beta subunit